MLYSAGFPLIGQIRIVIQFMFTPLQPTVLSASKLPGQAQSDAVRFFGTIPKCGENFALIDLVTKFSYTFGNPQQEDRYDEWMTVNVTGTIHMTRSLIHVEAIQHIVGDSLLLLKREVSHA